MTSSGIASSFPPRVLIVDDQTLFAEAIGRSLQAEGFEQIGLASTIAEAKAALNRPHPPDVVLLDLMVSGESGIALGREILAEWPDVRVMALTGRTDRGGLRAAMDAGFSGYLTKDMKVSGLVSAIRSATTEDERVVSGSIPAMDPARQEVELMISHLTNRERQILVELARGTSSPKIAEALSISPNTVRTHVGSILTKLGLHSRLEAAAFAVRHGLADGVDDSRSA